MRGIAIIAGVLGCLGGCKGNEASADRTQGDRPDVPRVIAPASGSFTGSARARERSDLIRRPTFVWDYVDFDDPISYDLQVDDGCAPGAHQACDFASPEADLTGLTEAQWRPREPLPIDAEQPLGRRYYWRVRACSGNACSPWSRVRYLEVGRARGDFDGDGFSDVAVGAPLVDAGGTDRGAVFVYYGTGDGIGRVTRLVDPAREDGSNFGVSVAVAGDVDGDGFADLLVGAAGSDGSRGFAYVYPGSVSGISADRYLRLSDDRGAGDDWFGAAVAGAGDVDGDGFADLLIGASGASRGGTNWGVAYVFHGGPEGPDRARPRILRLGSASDYDHFGYAVTSAGDVDGDGYDDIAIGSPGVDLAGERAGTDRGAVFVFHGSADGVLGVVASRLEAPVPVDHDRFGYAVAAAGDLDGDGRGDLIVGAPGADNLLDDGGTVYVYRGDEGGLGETAAAVLHDPRTEVFDRFGTSVAGAGDIDGDGFADVLVGTSGHQRGRLLVYHGGREGVLPRPAMTIRDPLGDGYNEFAESVAGAGDINGDGLDDIVIGASGADNGGVFRGSVVLYPGGRPTANPDTPLRIDDPEGGEHDHFGHVVSGR